MGKFMTAEELAEHLRIRPNTLRGWAERQSSDSHRVHGET